MQETTQVRSGMAICPQKTLSLGSFCIPPPPKEENTKLFLTTAGNCHFSWDQGEWKQGIVLMFTHLIQMKKWQRVFYQQGIYHISLCVLSIFVLHSLRQYSSTLGLKSLCMGCTWIPSAGAVARLFFPKQKE